MSDFTVTVTPGIIDEQFEAIGFGIEGDTITVIALF